MLERMKEVWEGEEMGPEHETQPRVLVGGSVEASFKRAARFGDGWIAAGAPPEQFAEWRQGFESAWAGAGRSEEPQNAALAYYSLGDRAEEDARDYLADSAGCQELFLFPSSSDPQQVDLLADALGM
jgi:alkanesulfonate monooxygenase SsuD/methylene tetrahydromethanopterin reductase-like flavin-dependent oxidoreductase (luciferase family)